MRVETVATASATHLGSMHIEMQRESAKNRGYSAHWHINKSCVRRSICCTKKRRLIVVIINIRLSLFAFSAFTMIVGYQKGYPIIKNQSIPKAQTLNVIFSVSPISTYYFLYSVISLMFQQGSDFKARCKSSLQT